MSVPIFAALLGLLELLLLWMLTVQLSLGLVAMKKCEVVCCTGSFIDYFYFS